jgi:hypothetical protein
VLLAFAAKLGVHLAASMNLHGADRIAVADGTYFAANCLTFLLRFLLFHYVLFADPRSKRGPAKPASARVQRESAGPPISSSSEAVSGAPVAGAPAGGAPTAGAPAAGAGPLADVTPDRR